MPEDAGDQGDQGDRRPNGTFQKGHKYCYLPPKPGKRRRGAKKKIEDGAGLRESILQSLTHADIKNLAPEVRAKLAASILPRERVQPAEGSGVRVIFSMTGLSGRCPHCGKEITARAPAATVPPPPAAERDPRMPRGPSEPCPELAPRLESAEEREQAALRKELEERLAATRNEPEIPLWRRPL